MRSLRTQLLFSHLALVLLMGLVMGGAILAFAALGRSIDRVLEDNFRTVLAAGVLRSALADQDAAFGILASGDTAEAIRLFTEASASADENLAILSETVDSQEEEALFLALQLQYDSYSLAAGRLMNANSLTLQPGALRLIQTELRPEIRSLEMKASQLRSINEREIIDANQSAQDRARDYFMRSMAITAVALLLAVLLAMRMVRLALTPLAILAKHAERIAQGDLDQEVRVPRKDEIGDLADSFNEMARRLAEVRRSDVRRLQRAQMMSDAALESLYDPVLVTDAKGRVVHLNRAAEGLFGTIPSTPRRPLSEHITDRRLIGAIDRAIHEQAVSAEEEDTAMIPITVGDLERTYRLRATPMKDDSGNLLGSVTVLEDITHLRTLDRLKTEFIGVASHELRTPVTSLLLSVQLLLEGAAGPLSESQRALIEAQKEDLDRLEKLMRDLLDVTRLEAGSSPPRFEMVSPAELIRSPLHGMEHAAAAKEIQLDVVCPVDLPLVRADRSQIGRVLTNLLANAIRHTPHGGKVTVSALKSSEGVLFRVEDTGEGIPEEYLGRIFERFVQVPGATQGGAGLGLSISSHIVKAHGGSMSVDSKPNRGSVFEFTLPREAAVEGKE